MYLIRQVAATDDTARGRASLADYYSSKGRNPNADQITRRLRRGYGDYNTTMGRDRRTSLDPDIRARIRTQAGREMLAEHYNRPPADDRELSGFIARHIRTQTTTKPSPKPSHSLKTAPPFSRMGANGIAQADTTELIAAAFDHRDSRASHPNLHTHVAVSNKVQAISADGIPRWPALDGAPLHKAAVAASKLYNTRLEAHLMASAGMRFAAAGADNRNKRPVREIVGAPTELIERWSSRRAAIDHRVGQLAKQFQTEHGREPTLAEMLTLSQQATLDTRQAKHEPRSLAEQRHHRRAEAIEILGSRHNLTTMIADITNNPTGDKAAITEEWVRQQGAAVGIMMGEHFVLFADEADHARVQGLLMPAFNGAALRRPPAMIAGRAEAEVRQPQTGKTLNALDR